MVCSWGRWWLVGCVLQSGFPGVDRPGWGLSVIPSPRGGGMECCDRCGRSGSIRWGDLARGGGHDVRDPRPTAVVGRSCAGRLQATDMPVT